MSMDDRIHGNTVRCNICGKTNRIIEDGTRYPARMIEVIYCASCGNRIGYKNSTSGLDTEII